MPVWEARTSPHSVRPLRWCSTTHDGYYTTGAGSDLGPGSRMRVQWRATSSDAWVTRFQGRLSELALQFNGFSFFTTRWVGALYRFTSGNIPGRLIINQTPQSIMTVLADAAGLATGERDFDTDTDEWNRQLSPGYQGVQEVQSMVDGFIYDAPDYKVRLELPATRTAKAVVARYTDGDPTAAELGVPPPRRLTRPFGIINHVDGEYHYYTPADSDASTMVVIPPTTSVTAVRNEWRTRTITYELPFTPSGNVTISNYLFEFSRLADDFAVGALGSIAHPATGAEYINPGAPSNTLLVRNLAYEIVGNTLCITFEVRSSQFFTVPVYTTLRIRQSVTLTDTVSFEQTVATFPRSLQGGVSIELYGYRPRPSPLVIGLYQATPLADDFTPDYADLDAAMQVELDHFAEPIPVFAIERACDTAAHRADILARRLSDKVHLTADGRSMLGFDGDCFVEAIQTTIRPTGELTQTLWIKEDRIIPQLSAPTGLVLTEAGGDITAAWNAVANATGYVLEWREEGSGAAWQTVDVTAPPHTFTP